MLQQLQLLLLLLSCIIIVVKGQSNYDDDDPPPPPPPVPTLNGRHFRITVVQENGFLDIDDNSYNNSSYNNSSNRSSSSSSSSSSINNNNNKHHHQSYHDNLRNITYHGYLIDMIYAIAEKANFTFTLLPPSGMGSACVPRISTDIHNNNNNDIHSNNSNNTTNNINDTESSSKLYDKMYRTQYNCGASDVNDGTVFGNSTTNTTTTATSTTTTSTDMYLGMFYVSPARQLINHFTIPFLPPYSGTLAMFGTATHIPDFPSLVQQQQQQQQQQISLDKNDTTTTTTSSSTSSSSSIPSAHPPVVGVQVTAETTCGPAGTALIQVLQDSYPGLSIKGIYGDEEAIYQHFYNGSCTVYITDGPIAAQYILRRSRSGQCTDRHGAPLGVIGRPMPFGLSHYAIGIRNDIPQTVVDTISYWMNILMTCNPLDPNGDCPDGNFASFYDGQGGTGTECGYVLFPEPPTDGMKPSVIVGIVLGTSFFMFMMVLLWHRYRINTQQRQFVKDNQIAIEKAEREREFNEFMAHEIRNPLASALAALNFVSSKTSDRNVVPDEQQRALVQSDVRVIDSSLQFVNELLRNMLDLHRSSKGHGIKLHMVPTDVMKDILEPVASILYMRGASVDIITECHPPNLYILADRMRLKQILLNLAFNATKFVERGFIRLRAAVVTTTTTKTTTKENEDQESVVLYVEDSGPGIPQSKRKALFTKFQDSLDVLNQGTGIGLALCKKLSLLMDASLYLDESFDSGIPNCPGTCFTMNLNQPPMGTEITSGSLHFVFGQNNRQSGMGESTCFSVREAAEKTLPDDLNVLFVDDDAMLRKMFGRVLNSVAPSWKMTEASNGETALRLIEEKEFDLIFVDQYMASVEKQMLGTETVYALRSKGVKAIICGLSANDVEDQFFNSGANYFMYKPFPCKKDALMDELVQLLRSQGAHEEKVATP